MKISLKRFFSVAVFALLCLLSLPLVACKEKEPTTEQLPPPENVQSTRGWLSWDAVEHAQGYYVRVGEGEAQFVETTSYEITSLPAKEAHQIRISARGDRENYADSDWTLYPYRLEEYPEEGYDQNGLLYRLMEDKRGYEVSKGKSDLVGMIDIRDEMFGLPVLRIAEKAFLPKEGEGAIDPRTKENINVVTTAVHLPERLESIGAYAFARLTSLEEVVLPESVTDLGDWAFRYCKGLRKVVFPKGLKEIPDGCFAYCSLEELTFPEGLERIGSHAFSGEYVLQFLSGGVKIENSQRFAEVLFPDSVKSIGTYAFEKCDQLERVRLPAGLTEQGRGIFYYCTALKRAEIPEGITSLGAGIFSGCKAMEEVTLPSTLTEIASEAFQNCRLKALNLPSALVRIGADAFDGARFRSVRIPEGVKVLGAGALSVSTLEEVILPKSLRLMAESAFGTGDKLTAIWYEGSFAEWQKLNVPLENGKYAYKMMSAIVYFYAAEKPEVEGNYWRYVDGIPTAWE